MLFNSIHYIFFLPLVFTSYYLTPFKYRWLLLLLASCYFYMSFIPEYILILLFTIITDYFVGIYLEKNSKSTTILILSLFVNIATLIIFKYYNFFADNLQYFLNLLGDSEVFIPKLSIILPIGLSFHTFQSMSYILEVYKGYQRAEKHFGFYWVYVMYFPQMVAGPIERPQNLIHQLHSNVDISFSRIIEGFKLIIIGFFMKCVVSDRLSIFVDAVYSNPTGFQSPEYWKAAYFFSFQIYCDFAGYSTIAIGSSKLFGIDLMKNFNFPYFSFSFSEFWSRWHISLSGWFRDYVYVPLGGNRVGLILLVRNLIIVFMISGIWHGANWTFVVWGLIHAIFISIEVLSKNIRNKIKTILPNFLNIIIFKIISLLFIFHISMIAWVFFRSNSVSEAVYILHKMFQFKPTENISLEMTLNLKTGFLAILFILGIDIFRYFNLNERYQKFISNYFLSEIFYCTLLILIFTAGVFNGSSFIYFQF